MDKLVLLTRHKSLGLLILLLVIVRVAWRLINTTPQLPARTPLWQHRLAQLIQFMLYVCLVTLPISGWLMSSARNFPVSVFGLFQLPDLVEPNERTFELARGLHESLAWALVILATIHVLGALQHHFVRQDDVLRRMLPFVRRRKT